MSASLITKDRAAYRVDSERSLEVDLAGRCGLLRDGPGLVDAGEDDEDDDVFAGWP